MSAWGERNFRLLFIGQTTSAFGNTLVPVALSFAVLDLTRSASDLGYVLGSGSAATVVFILFGGVIADRVSRRALMMAADAARFAAELVLGILLVTGHPSVLVLAALTAATGIAAALFAPASTGLIPALVRPEDLMQANSLQQTAASAAAIAGPAAAGLLVVTAGPGWAIIANALTFAVSVALLALLRLDHVPVPKGRRWLGDLREGWTEFWTRTWFRTVVLGASLINFLFAAYAVLGPVASKRYFDGAASWAVISTGFAVGAVAGGLLGMKLRPRRPLRAAVLFSAPAALPPLAISALLPVPVIAACGAACGGGLLIFNSLWQTCVQTHIPKDRLSRASSYDYFGSMIAYPIGLAVAGPIAAAAGVRPVMVGVAAVSTLLFAGMLLVPGVRNLAATPGQDAGDASDGRAPVPAGA